MSRPGAMAAVELAGWLTAPLLPLWAGASVVRGRWRADWRERWGLAVPPVQPGAVWIVASSVGEVRAGAALADALEGPTVLTADTDTGAAVARELVRVAGRKPVDHPWTLAPLWAEARPRAVVWVEGAWWPALEALARQSGVQTMRVGARPGPGTERRIRLGVEASAVWARDEAAVGWFRERGVAAALGGELKDSAPIPGNPLVWGREFAVAGSVRSGDIEAVGRVLAASELPWLVAPRHLGELGLWGDLPGRWVRRSALVDGRVPPGVDGVLLDTVGELAGCYQGACVALVGGTFDPAVGGHSPVEAWRAGVPTVAGPHRQGQGQAFERAGTQVCDARSVAAAVAQARGVTVPAFHTEAVDRTVAGLQARLGGRAPESSPRPWARPASWVHRGVRRTWHSAFDRGLRTVERVPVPVVSVGSANARSPGRTAAVRWLAGELRARGWRPGIASRGHKRPGRGLALSWQDPGWGALGDEAALLAREGWPVAVCADRVRAARALAEHGVDVVILDDGLQHRRLHRDLDLVVLDGRFPGSRGELPLGEGREEAVPDRVDGVILQHDPDVTLAVDVPVARARREPGPWHRGHAVVEGGPTGPVAAFAGIGRPADFRASLDLPVDRFRALADHQPVDGALGAELLAWADGRPLVCTDKDHVRLPAHVASQVWWRSVRLTIPHAPEAWFEGLDAASMRLA